jgi:serine/threonine protein kinase
MTSRLQSKTKVIFNPSKAELIAEGGEGKIYDAKNGTVVKIFKNTVNKNTKFKKVKEIISKIFPKHVIAPKIIVHDRNGKEIGYVMEKVDGEEIRALSSKKFVRVNGILKKQVLEMLIKIKDTLKELHGSSVYIGDLNEMNILIDLDCNVFFIDVDSWSVGKYRCTVANDIFKDPKLVKNFFSSETDCYSFAILIYKCLTRMHPFGGALAGNQQMNIMERMSRGISVIDNEDITVPKRVVDTDRFLSSRLRNDLKEIFDGGKRFLVDESLEEMLDNLEMCTKHGDYYYSRYDKCPTCEINAKERARFSKVGEIGGIPIKVIFSSTDVKYIINENAYIDKNGYIVFRNPQVKLPFTKGIEYHVDSTGNLIYMIGNDIITVQAPFGTVKCEKKTRTKAIVKNDGLYYINKSLNLIRFTVVNWKATSESKVAKVSINNFFDVHDKDNYFTCNEYDHVKIIDVSGTVFELKKGGRIVNHGIHHDDVTGKWLFIFEDRSGKYFTCIFDKEGGMLYFNDKIKYSGSLNNIAFNNSFMFKPSYEKITRFDYRKDEYKEFKIPIVSAGTKIIKKGKRITMINDRKIYEVG